MSNLKKVSILCCVLYAANLLASDGWQPIADLSSVQTLPQGVELSAGQAGVRVVAIAPNVIRLRYAPKGEFRPDQSLAVLPGAFPGPVNAQVDQSADAVTLDAGGVRVKILRSPLRVVFLDPKG